jgi:hypothetical protein
MNNYQLSIRNELGLLTPTLEIGLIASFIDHWSLIIVKNALSIVFLLVFWGR